MSQEDQDSSASLAISNAMDPEFNELLEEYPASISLYRREQKTEVVYIFPAIDEFVAFISWALAQERVSANLYAFLAAWQDQLSFYQQENEDGMQLGTNPAEQGVLFETTEPVRTKLPPRETDTIKRFKRNYAAIIGQVMVFFYEGQDGMHWYEETPKRIAEFFNDSERTDLFLRFLAATSPLRNIRENVRGALKALNQFDHGARYAPEYEKISRAEYEKAHAAGADNVYFKVKPVKGKMQRSYTEVKCPPDGIKHPIKCDDDRCCFDLGMPNHETNAARVAQGQELSGRKVTSFYKNLTSDPELDNDVTVDTWMLKAFGFRDMDNTDKSAPTEAEYTIIEDTVRELAEQVGVTPRQFQAAVWVGVKRMYGDIVKDTDEPFEAVLDREARILAGQNVFDFADEPVREMAERRQKKRDELMREAVFNPEHEFDDNPKEPNPEAQEIAHRYVLDTGLPSLQKTAYAPLDKAQAKRIADAFEQAENAPDDPEVQAAYNALAAEVESQFEYLPVEVIGTTEFGGYPYKTSQDLMDDIRNNRRMVVFDGGDDHAYFTRDQNFKFRAVHDYFGHAANGFEFGPRGEENAWIEHSKMFTPLARKALTTETRGQNSWVTAGPHADLPPSERPYAEQKAAILPDWVQTHPVLEEAYQDYPEFIEVRELAANPPDLESWGVWPNVIAFVNDMPDGDAKTRVIAALDQDPSLPLRDIEELAEMSAGEYKWN